MAFAAIWLFMIAAAICAQTPPGGYGPSSGGSATAGTNVPPAITYTASPNCPQSGGTDCTFIYADGYVVATDVSTTVGGVISCPNNDCNFTTVTQPQYGSSLTGMNAWVMTTALTNGLQTVACAISTINAGYTAQSITLASGACGAALTTSGTLIIGHKDATALNAAWAKVGNGRLELPTNSGNPIAKVGSLARILIDKGVFNTLYSQPGCNSAVYQFCAGAIEGGILTTLLTLTPDFAWTAGNCPGGPITIAAGSANVCIGPAPVLYRGIGAESFGMASATCGSPTPFIIMAAQSGGRMESVNVSNICNSSTVNANITCVLINGPTFHFSQGGAQSCGAVAGEVSGTFGLPAYSYATAFTQNPSPVSATAVGLLVDSGSLLMDSGSAFTNTLVNGTHVAAGTSHTGYTNASGGGIDAAVKVGATGRYYCYGCQLNNNLPSTGAAGLFLSASGAYGAVSGTSTWLGGASGNALFTVAGSTYVDLGGNVPPSTASSATNQVLGNYNAPAGQFVKGTCTGTANASVTNSLYGTGPNITATTCAGMTATLGTGVQVTGGGHTLHDLQCFSSATTVSVACTVMVNGSPSTVTCTMTAATSCFDGTHQVALNDGDLVSLKIVTGAAETGANIKAMASWD